MTKTGKELLELLRKISKDRDFLIGVLSNAKDDMDKQEIIDYIKQTQEPDMEYIILMSVYRDKQRKGEMMEETI